MRNKHIFKLTVSGLLIAVGIIIPMFSPLKIVMEPASFTLGSHVAVFIAMFIYPWVAAFVAVGTTIGFLFGGFPLVIVLRAASHIVFAVIGALWLKKTSIMEFSVPKLLVFSFLVSLIHAFCELLVVGAFYFGGSMSEGYYVSGFLMSVLLLVGLGTVIHSMVDFAIAYTISRPLKKTLLGTQ